MSAPATRDPTLAGYLTRPLDPPDRGVLEAIDSGPANPADALPRSALDRLLDPAPLPLETGWCWLDNGVGYVAVRTSMPRVRGEMVDWWFDWHPRDGLRYRIWHPFAHRDNRLEPPVARGAKPYWGAVHHPVEDVGTGVVRARISFCRPTELGFSTDALDAPGVAAIVCGHVGDDRLRLRHSAMAHVFLQDGDGLTLRSHFWLGAAMARPLNNRLVRRLALPHALPHALARHCAEEYAALAARLPELYERYGRQTADQPR